MATTEERLTSLEQQVSMVATKVDLMILEAQQQREDIRRLQDRQDAAQAKHDALSGLHQRSISSVILDELLKLHKPNFHIHNTEVEVVPTSQKIKGDNPRKAFRTEPGQ